MDRLSEKIIPLARIVRTHGFPKLGVCTFKADLFSVGGDIFKNKNRIYLSAVAVSDLQSTKVDWVEVELADKIAPHGGAFGQAKAILVKLARGEDELRGHLIGLRRDQFPLLEKAFYVADLIGLRVADQNGKIVGTIKGFEDNFSGGSLASVNLLVKTETGKEFAFPSQWISYEDYAAALASENKLLKVADIEEWMIDSSTANDENE